MVLIDFAILNSNFKFTPPPIETDIPTLISTYEIDIDFAVVENKDEHIRVFVKTSINQGANEKAGYSIFAEGASIFNLLKDENMPEDELKSLVQSSISIALNNLRGFISSLTSNAPFGRYILPSIDMRDLISQKAHAIQEKRNTPENSHKAKITPKKTAT